jgi:hypothetical protein
MSRSLIILTSCLFLFGCSEDAVERFAFEKTLKYGLTKNCDKDKECVAAVDEQLPTCIEKGDYKAVLRAKGEQEAIEHERFSLFLFSCIVDNDGNPYFVYKG